MFYRDLAMQNMECPFPITKFSLNGIPCPTVSSITCVFEIYKKIYSQKSEWDWAAGIAYFCPLPNVYNLICIVLILLCNQIGTKMNINTISVSSWSQMA